MDYLRCDYNRKDRFSLVTYGINHDHFDLVCVGDPNIFGDKRKGEGDRSGRSQIDVIPKKHRLLGWMCTLGF